jgi:hypothetical protein
MRVRIVCVEKGEERKMVDGGWKQNTQQTPEAEYTLLS